MSFLTACLMLAQYLGSQGAGMAPQLFREGLTIAGWVAMWRPLQIYLYDWWPLWQRQRLYGRMSLMPVELRIGQA